MRNRLQPQTLPRRARKIPIISFALALLASTSCTANNTLIPPNSQIPFTVNGKPVSLADDNISVPLQATGDVNNDGINDLAAVIALDSQGSGVFHYINVFLNKKNGTMQLVGEEFIADRIQLNTMTIYDPNDSSELTGLPYHPDDKGLVMLSFLAYDEDQAFSEKPRLFLTRHWKVENGTLVLLHQN